MSIWSPDHKGALWLGEVVYGTTGEDDWDYVCGWARSIERPELSTLKLIIPADFAIQESWISMLPAHPDYYERMKA